MNETGTVIAIGIGVIVVLALWVWPIANLSKKGRTGLAVLCVFLFPLSILIAAVASDKNAEANARYAAERQQRATLERIALALEDKGDETSEE